MYNTPQSSSSSSVVDTSFCLSLPEPPAFVDEDFFFPEPLDFEAKRGKGKDLVAEDFFPEPLVLEAEEPPDFVAEVPPDVEAGAIRQDKTQFCSATFINDIQ